MGSGSHPSPPARPRRHTLTLRPHGGMATPRFHRARWTDRLPARPGSCHFGYSSQPLPLYLSFPSSRQAALLRVSSFSAVRRNPPRFEVLPHGGVYCRCRKLCTIGARLRAPGLGLGALPLGGVSRETPRGLPAGVSSRRHPFHLPRLGRVQAPFHRGLMDSIQFSKNVF